MKFRLIEEYGPVRDTTIYFTEKRVLGLWLGIFSYVDGSCSYQLDEARKKFDRIRKAHAGKTKRVIEPATL